MSKALDNEVTKLPNWFFAKIQKFMEMSKNLSVKRGALQCMVMRLELKPASDYLR